MPASEPNQNNMPTDLTVQCSKGERLGPAIELICTQYPEEYREDHFRVLSSHLRKAPPGTSGVLHVERHGLLVAALMWTIYPGKIAILSAPGVTSMENRDALRALYRAAAENLSATTAELVFTSLSDEQQAVIQPLQDCGFGYLSRLVYLAAMKADFPSEPPATHYLFEATYQTNPSQFAEVVEATYQGTLDCPQLNGMRQTSDVLASYRATSPYSPDLWFVLQHKNLPVGCLILADHAETNQMELVYMGLLVEERGRGRGAELVRYAQWLARCRDRDALLLAVDANNHPAMKTYLRLGFQPLDERSVFLRVLRPRDTGISGNPKGV